VKYVIESSTTTTYNERFLVEAESEQEAREKFQREGGERLGHSLSASPAKQLKVYEAVSEL
jgi:hypothetical protein